MFVFIKHFFVSGEMQKKIKSYLYCIQLQKLIHLLTLFSVINFINKRLMFILYKNKNYNIHKRQILENVILSQNLIFLRILISKFLMKNHIFHAKNLCKNLKINILDLASKKFVVFWANRFLLKTRTFVFNGNIKE